MEQINQDNELDRYETLVEIAESLVEQEYVIYETDKAKGDRITIVDGIAGEIVNEKKFGINGKNSKQK